MRVLGVNTLGWSACGLDHAGLGACSCHREDARQVTPVVPYIPLCVGIWYQKKRCVRRSVDREWVSGVGLRTKAFPSIKKPINQVHVHTHYAIKCVLPAEKNNGELAVTDVLFSLILIDVHQVMWLPP